MRKRLTKEDRQLIRLVNARLRKGMSWPEIGDDLGKDWKAIYNRLYTRCIANPDRTLTPLDEIAA